MNPRRIVDGEHVRALGEQRSIDRRIASEKRIERDRPVQHRALHRFGQSVSPRTLLEDPEEARAQAARTEPESGERRKTSSRRARSWCPLEPRHIIGLLVLAAGLVLVYFGVYALDWVAASVKEVVTGTYSVARTALLMTGSAAAIVGVVIFDTTRTRAV